MRPPAGLSDRPGREDSAENAEPRQVGRDRGDDAAAPEGCEMAAAEPVDRRLTPVSPQGMGMLGWNDAVAAAGDDQEPLAWNSHLVGERRVHAEGGTQLLVRHGGLPRGSRGVGSGLETPREVAEADR